jgi:hypothetical protein
MVPRLLYAGERSVIDVVQMQSASVRLRTDLKRATAYKHV